MIASGERLDLSTVPRPTVDKHSTGGVGDKITLPLTPLVAACGAAVPQLSGRGFGHTGGTLDKLETIPGFRVNLTNKQFLNQLRKVGAAVCAAGPGLAPADRKLYALRDVTGTVEAIPLIASSIMSKKIAEGTGALVLDVKVGSGAFMKSLDTARELARTMVELGGAHGVTTVALLTDMSTPLGRAIGNAVEVEESVEVLAGGGPADVVELTLALAREMLACAGLSDVDPACRARLRKGDGLLAGDGQGAGRRPGRAAGCRRGNGRRCGPTRAGYVSAVDAFAMGVAAWRLGRRAGPQGGPGQRRGRCRAAPQAGGEGAARRRALRVAGRRRGPDPGRARGGADGGTGRACGPDPRTVGDRQDRTGVGASPIVGTKRSNGGNDGRADRAADPDPGAGRQGHRRVRGPGQHR